jgi:hypothetical protein
MTLAIRHKVSARSFLHPMCTCGTLLHPMCTYETCSYSSVTLVIHHKSLCMFLSPSDVYLWDPCPSDLWDPTAYVSRVPVGPFTISIRPVGSNGLRVTCTCGTFLHLHPTRGTQWLAYHMYLWDLSPSLSDLWDPTACVSLGPFSIRPVGPNGLRVTCTCGTFLRRHSTCGTWRLACHLYLVCRRGLVKSNSKKPWDLGVEPWTQSREWTVFTIDTS